MILGRVLFSLTGPGPLAAHMANHILLMNVLAPMLVLAWQAMSPRPAVPRPASYLALSTVVQLALLWGWHAPGVMEAAMKTHAVHFAMQASLFAAALWFWLAVFSDTSAFRWRALLSLLMTGKLFCLLGVLLVFSPRWLYGADMALHTSIQRASSDQQLAGLLMVIACPLTYVLAGILLAARALRDLTNGSEQNPTSQA